MARRLTKESIRKMLAKGLTGWEAGKLVLQDFADQSCGKPSFLTNADIEEIKRGLTGDKNIRDYNNLMAMCRGIGRGLMVCGMAWSEACLNISLLSAMLKDTNRRNTIKLFTSCGPQVVTAKEYRDIIKAQREKKLMFEYSLGYVIEERFYTIAPTDTREEIEELGLDIESAESLVSALPDKYTDLYTQAITEIQMLYTTGKLNPVYHEEDAKVAETLMTEWQKKNLSGIEVAKLLDMLFVTGQQLYECEELPEWKPFINEYQQYWLSDDDERFQHTYAVLQDCPECWTDDNGYYKELFSISKWAVRETESVLGLRADKGEKTKSIKSVSQVLLTLLKKAELDIRTFLGVKAVIDTASEVVGMSFSDNTGGIESVNERVELYTSEYNYYLKTLKKERPWDNSKVTKLEKVTRNLPPVDLQKLKPSKTCMQQLKDNIMNDLGGGQWLYEKVCSLEYDDGFSFRKLLQK